MEIKTIKLTLFAPEGKLSNGIDYEVKFKDDGTIVDALGFLDKEIYENRIQSVFPLYKGLIQSYLQLIWDAENNKIYDDCAVNAYGPNREFMPLMENPDFNLYPNSEITIAVHADWWAEVMKERLNFGTFKRIIMKRYGKDHETFAHYFKKT
ncbi:hypothetical protein LCGC14_3073660 [marine sediment metagenome]|uniref:Uncharacterized protein n=1 Tax=marine sediment metagenome TaxID=412755 RepID=A0A0F8XDZ0_9ZZZZ